MQKKTNSKDITKFKVIIKALYRLATQNLWQEYDIRFELY